MTDRQDVFEVVIEDQYVARCDCGWQSEPWDTYRLAEGAGAVHQEEAHDA
jgi:hypothetical protein